MQVSTILSWRSRNRDTDEGFPWSPRKESFFEKHHVGEIVQGLVVSSVMWGLLAVGVYAVYSLVLGTL
jgi:hypothetical protein